MAEDLDNSIRQNAEGPAKAAADGVNVEQHKLPDQIAADMDRLRVLLATASRQIAAQLP